jgi:hypothetical protein
MQRLLLASSILAALMYAQPAAAADIATIPAAPPVYVEPAPVVVTPAPVVVVPPTGCWRYGTLGWGWYPCLAGPPAYWHTYKGWRPHWARQHWLFYR